MKIWITKKKKKKKEKRKTFRLNKRFRSWKQIFEALLRVKSLHQIHVGCFLQTRFSKILNLLIKSLGRAFVLKYVPESFKHSVNLVKPREKIKSSVRNLKNSVQCLKSLTAWFYHNAVHAVPKVNPFHATDLFWYPLEKIRKPEAF